MLARNSAGSDAINPGLLGQPEAIAGRKKIEVIDMSLRSLKGHFIGYSEGALSLRTEGGEISIQRDHVFRVTDRETSHRLRNILLGLAMGTAGGAAVGAIGGKSYHEEGETGVFMLVFTPIGGGSGQAWPPPCPPVIRRSIERRIESGPMPSSHSQPRGVEGTNA